MCFKISHTLRKKKKKERKKEKETGTLSSAVEYFQSGAAVFMFNQSQYKAKVKGDSNTMTSF